MSDPRTTKHWVIKVNGSTKVDVGPGENVEIGRRPLRPLANDGRRRLEIDDKTRSMSKRHAVFTVADNGGASVTDLNSTNGSYVVDEKGLRRLKADQDFILPDSPMRLQFGDVPVDFVRIDAEEGAEGGNAVTDLFDYASSGAQSPDFEPDMADMSVDDILNLRAGEPTTAFSAADVASRLKSASPVAAENEDGRTSQGATSRQDDAHVDMAGNADNKDDDGTGTNGEKDARHDGDTDVAAAVAAASAEAEAAKKAAREEANHAVDRISLNVMAPNEQSGGVEARDLFKDAMESESESRDSDAGKGGEAQTARPTQAPVQTTGAAQAKGSAGPLVDLPAKGKTEAKPVSLPSRRNDGRGSQASSQPLQQRVPAQNAGAQQATGNNTGTATGVKQMAAGVDRTPRNDNSANANGTVSSNAQYVGRFSRSGSDDAVFVPMDEGPRQGAGTGAGTANTRNGNGPISGNPRPGDAATPDDEERSKFMRPVVRDMGSSPVSGTSGLDETQAFKPTFEPGSIFEKVSNGEFDQMTPEIEVEGMSSDDAKRTTDFSEQFEMAKHPELLPFLAMNPSLYDDLYEWLATVGNDDIDAALAANSGYIEYRKEVAEGREQ